MGGRGGSSGAGGGGGNAQSKLAGLQADLDYALMKAHEYGNVPYGGTLKTRERFIMWDDEVRKLREQISKIKKKQ